MKVWRGVLQQTGRVDRQLEHNLATSIVRPIVTEHIYDLNQRFAHDEAIWLPHAKSPVYSSREIHRAFEDGLVDPKRVVKIPWQEIKRAMESGKLDESALSKFRTEVLSGAEDKPGRKYILADREKATEFFGQLGEANKAVEGIAKVGRFQSRATLGFSPSWVLFQFPAEGFQMAVGGGYRTLVPLALRNAKAFKALDRDQQISIEAVAGAGRGAVIVPKQGFTLSTFDKFFGAMDNSPWGRAMTRTASGEWLGMIDRLKGGEFRKRLALAHIDRELNGMFHNMPELWGLSRGMTKTLRGMSREDQLKWLSSPEGRSALEQVGNYVDDMMGNWTAFTRNERLPAAFSFFYPFMRMSLRFMLHTFPRAHPLRAGALYYLGQLNTNEVRRLIGGSDPAFLSELLQGVEFTDQGERTIDVSRMNPASNALINAGITGFGPQSLQILQPLIGAVAGAALGADTSKGRPVVPEGAAVTDFGDVLQMTGGHLQSGLTAIQRGTLIAGELMKLWYPVRAINAGKRVEPGNLPLPFGKQSPYSPLYQKLLPSTSAALKGQFLPVRVGPAEAARPLSAPSTPEPALLL
jgi:hypothetical protein